MENRRTATLRELNQGVEPPSQTCLNFPPNDHDWAIKPHIINILSKFHGHSSENPYTHLKTFAQECEAFKPRETDMERAKLRAFRFTLEGNAKLWYNGLLNNSITSWGQLVRAFLQKYWNASKAIAAEKNLVSIKQQPHENFGEYFQRFKNLQEICPKHGVTEQGLINHFYAGMNRTDRD